MRAVNIYTLTRMIEKNLYSHYEKALSQREEEIKVRSEEIEIIKAIITNLRFRKVPFQVMEDWFYSFSIPQIGKEFDLLKIDKRGVVLNLELKSQDVPEEQIEKQLIKNRYYLSHIGNTIYSFTYVRVSEKQVKIYVYDGRLRESSYEELINKMLEIREPISQDIELLFRPKEFLISPLNTPDKFLKDQYYLSSQQESIKNEILSCPTGLCGIKGSAGTGKTLLLYDIAKVMSSYAKVCIVHCGILSDGHRYIDSHMKNVSVITAKSVSPEIIKNYSIICVDETQRLYKSTLDKILNAYYEGEIETCVFSYDFAQVLSQTEERRNNPQRLNAISEFKEYKLTDKIRTNKEVFSFIRNMMRLSDKPKKYVSYADIDILYANDVKEADTISYEYKRRGYTFITFTPSQYIYNIIDHYAENINSHQVIGQEFDKVVVILDNNFRYSKEGILQGK